MISVVMTTYNGEKFIAKQLYSILEQTLLPSEIIVCDDRSTDHTVELIKHLAGESKTPIYIYQNRQRLGFALNFKRAIEYAKGDYIFLSDQDDIWRKDKIELCVRCLERNQRILSLSSNYMIMSENGNVQVSETGDGSLSKISLKSFGQHPKYPGMAMVFRRNIWDKMIQEKRIDWSKGVAHDWAINFVAAVEGGMYFLDEKLVYYRQHLENTAGMLRYQDKSQRFMQRGKTIEGLIRNWDSVNQEDHLVKVQRRFQKKRLDLFRKKKVMQLIVWELQHLEYISKKSMLGDLYALIR